MKKVYIFILLFSIVNTTNISAYNNYNYQWVEVLVKIEKNYNIFQIFSSLKNIPIQNIRLEEISDNLYFVELYTTNTNTEIVDKLQLINGVNYAEPNYDVELSSGFGI